MSVEGQSGVLEVFYERSKAGVKGPRAGEAVLERVEESGEGFGGGGCGEVCIGMKRVCREQLPGRPGSPRSPWSGPEGLIPGLWVPAAT